jgi:hypothetical protein
MKKLMMSALLGVSLSASAVTVEVNNVVCGPVAAGALCDGLTAELKSAVNQDLPEVSIGEYGTGLANANNFAYKGITSDYSDAFDYFMVRGAGGLAVDGDLDKPESASGVGVGASVTVGINLDVLPVDKIGPIDLSKMDLFVSFMGYDLDQEIEESKLEGEISNFSVMARYQIIEGKDFIPGYLLQWGGVFLHTGFQKSSSEISFTQSFEDQTVESGSNTASFGDTTAKFSIETSTMAIPVEVSTFIRAAYVFTLYGGAGFDLVSGSTDVGLAAKGTASGTGIATGYSADIVASESDSGDADATNMRAFAGLQFNVPLFRLYAQMNTGLGNDLVGFNLGAKILF